jgi:hypothetical protein
MYTATAGMNEATVRSQNGERWMDTAIAGMNEATVRIKTASAGCTRRLRDESGDCSHEYGDCPVNAGTV